MCCPRRPRVYSYTLCERDPQQHTIPTSQGRTYSALFERLHPQVSLYNIPPKSLSLSFSARDAILSAFDSFFSHDLYVRASVCVCPTTADTNQTGTLNTSSIPRLLFFRSKSFFTSSLMTQKNIFAKNGKRVKTILPKCRLRTPTRVIYSGKLRLVGGTWESYSSEKRCHAGAPLHVHCTYRWNWFQIDLCGSLAGVLPPAAILSLFLFFFSSRAKSMDIYNTRSNPYVERSYMLCTLNSRRAAHCFPICQLMKHTWRHLVLLCFLCARSCSFSLVYT